MKKFTFATILVIVSLTFVFAACGYSGKIESVQGHSTIYRYKVEEVQLLNAESEKEEILTRTKDFNYYYDESETEIYRDISTSGVDEKTLTYYFPSLTMSDSYTCDQYNCRVKIRIMLGKVDKEYRPDYSVKGDLVTYTYYRTIVTMFSVEGAFKKEMDYAEYAKVLREYRQGLFDLRYATDDEIQRYRDEMTEKYQYYVCIYSAKVTTDVSSGFRVEYHP